MTVGKKVCQGIFLIYIHLNLEDLFLSDVINLYMHIKFMEMDSL